LSRRQPLRALRGKLEKIDLRHATSLKGILRRI
jgi:hypothetical protein